MTAWMFFKYDFEATYMILKQPCNLLLHLSRRLHGYFKIKVMSCRKCPGLEGSGDSCLPPSLPPPLLLKPTLISAFVQVRNNHRTAGFQLALSLPLSPSSSHPLPSDLSSQLLMPLLNPRPDTKSRNHLDENMN